MTNKEISNLTVNELYEFLDDLPPIKDDIVKQNLLDRWEATSLKFEEEAGDDDEVLDKYRDYVRIERARLLNHYCWLFVEKSYSILSNLNKPLGKVVTNLSKSLSKKIEESIGYHKLYGPLSREEEGTIPDMTEDFKELDRLMEGEENKNIEKFIGQFKDFYELVKAEYDDN